MHDLVAPQPQVTTLRHPPGWAREYIGIPFAEHGRDRRGCDCWGLVRLVLGERYRIWLPAYCDAYRSTRDVAAIEARLLEARGAWLRVSGPFFREADVVLLEVDGRATHLGLIIGWPWMLHIEAGIDAACDRLDGIRWRTGWARGAHSVWRHPEMLG